MMSFLTDLTPAIDLAISSALTFSAIENLVGGTANDSFVFVGSGSLAGTLAAGLGTDTLNYTNYGSAVTVDLTTGQATAIGEGLINKVTGIENIKDYITIC